MIVALANQKGGVAKTTSTICLGGLLLESSSCLVIDLDPQANLTIGLGVEVQEGQLTTYDTKSGLTTPFIKKDNLQICDRSADRRYGQKSASPTVPNQL